MRFRIYRIWNVYIQQVTKPDLQKHVVKPSGHKLKEFKNRFIQLKTYTCPITGVVFNPNTDGHVDHEMPLFQQIVTGFIQKEVTNFLYHTITHTLCVFRTIYPQCAL